MRITFITETLDVDDLEVGYIHRVIEELAHRAKHIDVICVKQGYHTLPQNVKVRSLGGEKKKGLIHRSVAFLWHLSSTVWRRDGVFIYGSPWFVFLGAPLWKLFRIPVGIWYELGEVGPLLGAALPILSFVFTPTSEAFHSGGDKKRVVGYGIDTDFVAPLNRPKHDGTFRIITGGHISQDKDYATLIRAAALISETTDAPFRVSIIGAPKTGDGPYAEEMRTLVRSYGLGEIVTFLGPVKNHDAIKLYRESDLYISVFTRGRVEKSLAEAAAAGLPVVTSNQAFKAFTGDYDSFVFFPKGEDAVLAERIRHVMRMSYDARHTLGHSFRQVALRDHSHTTLADGIIHAYKNG